MTPSNSAARAPARHTAAIAVDRCGFPGGAYLVDLRGYGPERERVYPAQLFAPLLRHLSEEEVPADAGERAAQP